MAGISSGDLPLIAVCGATGAQGGSVVNALLDTKKFRVRALTRNPDGEKGKLLLGKGCEVVKLDFDEKASIPPAFIGCHGAFLVTNFWEHMDAKKEYAQATSLADGCKSAGVKHVVWSTLEDTRLFQDDIPKIGEYKLPHFDEKGRANEYMKSIGLPVTLLYTSFYLDNFITQLKPQKQEDGSFIMSYPMGDALLAGVTVKDIGRSVAAVFSKGLGEPGESVGVASEHLKMSEMAECLSAVSGRKVVYVALEPDAYRKLGFPGATELGNMFQFYRDHSKELCVTRDMKAVKALFQPTTFKEFCIENHGKILD